MTVDRRLAYVCFVAAAAAALADDLDRCSASRLSSVVAYGPHAEGQSEAPLTALALVSSLTIAGPRSLRALASRWERARLATPLILPADEFRRSLDAFPLEYGEIIRAHVQRLRRRSVRRRRDSRARICAAPARRRSRAISSTCARGSSKPRGQPARHRRAGARQRRRRSRRCCGTSRRLHGVHPLSGWTRHGAAPAPPASPTTVVRSRAGARAPADSRLADAARLFPAYLAAVEQLADRSTVARDARLTPPCRGTMRSLAGRCARCCRALPAVAQERRPS